MPDHGGWYSQPVTFTAAGTDATSGVLGCDEPTYAGPDSDRRHRGGDVP